MKRPRSPLAIVAIIAGIALLAATLVAGLIAIFAVEALGQESAPETQSDPNQIYANCMATARSNPEAAEADAQAWLAEGGGGAAEHCLAVALIGLGRYAEAGEALEKLARALPQTESSTIADLFGQAAQAWLLDGSYDRAIAVLDQSIKLAPYNVEFLIDRAVARASAARYWEAIDDLNEAEEMAPGRPDILVLRATAYRFVEVPELAKEDLDRVLAKDPRNPDALFERGMLNAMAGDIAAAREDWQLVVQIAPGSVAAETAKENLAATAGQ